MSICKDGDKVRKKTSFCQQILNRQEFAEFCEGIGRSGIATDRGNAGFESYFNRLIVPADRLEVFPEFALKSSSFDVNCRVSWNAGGLKDERCLRQLSEILTPLAGMGILGFDTPINLAVGKYKIGVNIRWKFIEGVPMPQGAGIGLVHNILHLPEDYFSRNMISGMFPQLAFEEFARSLIVAKLPFLRDVRLKPGGTGVGVGIDHSEQFLKSFVAWMADGKGRSIDSVRVEFIISKSDHHRWGTPIVRQLMSRTGGGEACLSLRLSHDYAEGGNSSEVEYHEWLSRLIGLKTLSGRAARYGVVRTSRGGYPGEVSCYFVPEGVCLGYLEYEGRPKSPPREILDLLPGVDWLRSLPPGDELFPLPVYRADERHEPLPGIDVKAAIESILREATEWRSRQLPPEPDSLEYQLERLVEIGFKLSPYGIQDLLDYQDRKWYESFPYTHLLTRMAMLQTSDRIRFVSFAENQHMVSLPEILRKIDVAGLIKVDHEGLYSDVNVSGERRVVVFEDFGLREHLWEFEEPVDRITTDLLKKYDLLFQQQNSASKRALGLYSMATGPDSLVLAALRIGELEKINSLVPVPFVLLNP